RDDLVTGVQTCALPISRSIWQQTVRWYLGTRIGGAAVSRETTHEAEPAGPLRRLTCRTLHGPAQCELIGDVGRALPFEKGDEIRSEERRCRGRAKRKMG